MPGTKISVDLKGEGKKVARWAELAAYPTFIAIVENYTNQSTGYYERKHWGTERTLGR